MKISILIFILVLTSLTTFSQELTYDDLFSGERPMGPFKSYVSKDGTIFKVGDKVKIGTPAPGYTFAYIWVGEGIIMQEELLGPSGSNTEVKIKRIIIGGSKKSGYKALFRTTGMAGMVRGYVIIVEKAIEHGEIKYPGVNKR